MVTLLPESKKSQSEFWHPVNYLTRSFVVFPFCKAVLCKDNRS